MINVDFQIQDQCERALNVYTVLTSPAWLPLFCTIINSKYYGVCMYAPATAVPIMLHVKTH